MGWEIQYFSVNSAVLFITPRHYMTNIRNFLGVTWNLVELSHNFRVNDSCSLQSPVCVEEIQPLFSNNDEITVRNVKNMDSKEEYGTYNPDTLEENPIELLSTLRGSSSTDTNILEQTEVQDDREEIRTGNVYLQQESFAYS
jgi:hypothetical protein